MSTPLIPRQAHVRQGAYLPHWTLQGSIYHVVLRLGDSLPVQVVARLRAEHAKGPARLAEASHGQTGQPAHQGSSFSTKIEAVLDNGLGACWLGRDDVAAVAAASLQYFHGTRYRLHAWCVMPNHVHVLVQPLEGHDLPGIVHSWKRFIAHEANRLLARSGQFWQPEYYDHLLRDQTELKHAMDYIQANPSEAGLTNWRWVWPENCVARVSHP